MQVSSVVVLAMAVAVVLAAPRAQQDTTPVPIVSQNSNQNADGSFQYAYEAGNGIRVQDQGDVKQFQVPNEDGTGTVEASVPVRKGSYSYTAPDGTPISVQWVADETGFHAQGDHLPVGPGL